MTHGSDNELRGGSRSSDIESEDEVEEDAQDDVQDDAQDKGQDDAQDEARDEQHDDAQDEAQDDQQDDAQDEAHDDAQEEEAQDKDMLDFSSPAKGAGGGKRYSLNVAGNSNDPGPGQRNANGKRAASIPDPSPRPSKLQRPETTPVRPKRVCAVKTPTTSRKDLVTSQLNQIAAPEAKPLPQPRKGKSGVEKAPAHIAIPFQKGELNIPTRVLAGAHLSEEQVRVAISEAARLAYPIRGRPKLLSATSESARVLKTLVEFWDPVESPLGDLADIISIVLAKPPADFQQPAPKGSPSKRGKQAVRGTAAVRGNGRGRK